ncbi:Sensor protein TorS [Legionella massiliensis]|uniref:histidine kinase n=1 Tax=Legionella massiliensis TaxID=1034943 RepID=A0A078KYB1_9GAMM|nr:hybrid sensor histidine kinase/response regulator [Legionella massiliensis]CDZ79385.1 Sensor protein TorS [Legionella massiliensis]CEE15123.1 Sensor protein TorS [Legionella massiliensis]
MTLKQPKIIILIETFFIASIFLVLMATLLVGIYFNKYEEQQKQNENIERRHHLLSQLIVPSLAISDISEVRKLLHMSSGVDETYMIIDDNGTVIMSDYGNRSLYGFGKSFNNWKICNRPSLIDQTIEKEKYSIYCSSLIDNSIFSSNKKIGLLFSFTKSNPFILFSPAVIYFILILTLLFLTLIFLLRKILYMQLLQPLLKLKNAILNRSLHNVIHPKIEEIKKLPWELVEIKDAFERLLSNLQEEYNGRIEAEKMKALVDVMAGVCHDIRSPLSILEFCIIEAKDYLPKKDVQIQVEALQNIRDIANNLLDKYREPNAKLLTPIETDFLIKPLLLSSIIDTVISHKKQEWKNKPCKLIFNAHKNAKNKWINSIESETRRVLSNILNNAYESLRDNGSIDISLKSNSNELLVIISDNGIGIPFAHLKSVLNGFSSKHPGKGIGLSNAKQYMESLGGSLAINSQENSGTQVTLTFPFFKNPLWLPEEIIICSNQTIILLDDDLSIHNFWQKKLRNTGVKLIQFYSGSEFVEWYGQSEKSDSTLYFMDYELRKESLNGVDLLKSINPQQRGFLITSHAEKNIFQRTAEELGIWLLPKCVLNEIPVKIIAEQ